MDRWVTLWYGQLVSDYVIKKPVTRVNYRPHSGVNVQLAPDLVGDLRDVIQFMILSMLGKSLRSDRQMAGKVGQLDCREKLDGIGIWICGRGFELLMDRCILFPVRQENIVKQRCQLVDLTWNRHIACFNCHWSVLFHFGFWLFPIGSSGVVSIAKDRSCHDEVHEVSSSCTSGML